ncbi:MAG TPA: gamma-aminobutyraldehyde dehydrogenase, partial [Burkholderiaceae bacterium]|nr:gamma-aminobutyraldehyde dehydrogenase [Burkholderiaceae bacterium]
MGHTKDLAISFPTELLIDHQLVKGQGPAEPIINPATGEVLCEVAEASPEQVSRAVLAASRAYE